MPKLRPRQLDDLREQLRQLSEAVHANWGLVSCGLPAVDRLLPGGGLRRGTIVEWLALEPGSGGTCCALRAARAAAAGERPVVVVDRDGTFHPPGLAAIVPWRNVLLVRCRERGEAEWAVGQALGTSGVGAVLTRFDEDDERPLRRAQLAAERSGALGLIVRHVPQQPEVCFSDVRMLVSPLVAGDRRRVRVEILRSRQGGIGAAVETGFDDDAISLPDAPDVRRRSLGA